MIHIKLADISIQIHNRFAMTEAFCRGYETDQAPVFSVCVSPEELEQERAMQTEEFPDDYLETVCMYRSIAFQVLSHGAFLLHASVIEVDGQGYAFLAPSGVGKSTQTQMWLSHFGSRARVINGDKPLVRMCVKEQAVEFRAYGTPWSGKEGLNCNASVPLKALFLLERGAEASCQRASQEESVDRIFRQLLLPSDLESMDRLLSLIDGLLETVPCYILHCTLKEDSVTTAYDTANT